MSKLNVIHVITTIDNGGAEKQLLILAREQLERGFEVSVFYLKGSGALRESLLSSGISVIDNHANKNPIHQVILWRNYLRKFKGRTIIHAHLPRAEILAFFSQFKFRLIITRHNAEPFATFLPRTISSFLSRLVSMRASWVIAISGAVKEFLLISREVATKTPITVIYYGFDKMFPTQGVKSLPARDKPLRIVTLARLVPQKGLATLIEASHSLSREGLRFSLDIYGEGFLLDDLKKKVSNLGLQAFINFKGKTSKPELELPHYDFFILPSVYEGFGLSVLEALQSGLRLILSDLPVFKEIMGSSFTGFFKCGDSIELSRVIKELCFNANYDWNDADRNAVLSKFDPKRLHKSTSEIYHRVLRTDDSNFAESF